MLPSRSDALRRRDEPGAWLPPFSWTRCSAYTKMTRPTPSAAASAPSCPLWALGRRHRIGNRMLPTGTLTARIALSRLLVIGDGMTDRIATAQSIRVRPLGFRPRALRHGGLEFVRSLRRK